MSDKCKRNDTPLLIVGLGGTGYSIIRSIKSLFFDRVNNLEKTTLLPSNIAAVLIDTDKTGIIDDPHDITSQELCDINSVNAYKVFKDGCFTPEEQAWINPNINLSENIHGSGGIRQLGRFHLFRSMKKVNIFLSRALSKIMDGFTDHYQDLISINILICGSLSGGTGSGIALDLAYIIRKLLNDQLSDQIFRSKIFGMFLLPECIIQKSIDALAGRENELRANAFASIKEIDYWMRQDQHGEMLDVQYPGFTVRWDCKPFDYLGYLGHTWENGQPIKDSYDVAIEAIDNVFFLFATEQRSYTTNGVEQSLLSERLAFFSDMTRWAVNAPYPVSTSVMSIGYIGIEIDKVMNAATSENKSLQEYLREKLIPWMGYATSPMLHLSISCLNPTEACEFHQFFISENSPIIKEVLKEWIRGSPTRCYLANNPFGDRIQKLSFKLMMGDIWKLFASYRLQLSQQESAVSQGIHLDDINWINDYSKKSDSIEKSWGRLYCPIPQEEIMLHNK